MPKLISIAGSSGVGKTTISRIIQHVLGEENVICISGDDLHKWERNNPIWETKTHLDPECNDLDRGFEDLTHLMRGEPFIRRCYSHETGNFYDKAIKICPEKTIIYEGLHALHDQRVLDISDIKIFVDTDSGLKNEWKLKRDTHQRGYTESQVAEILKRRESDDKKFIFPQMGKSNVLFYFEKSRDGSIYLGYGCSEEHSEFVFKVQEFYNSLCDFVSLCKNVSLDPSLVQGRGGNISVKSQSGLIIKSSGSKLEDVNLNHGFCVCDKDGNRKSGDEKPSIEIGFHLKLPEKYIVHTHPVHLNAILCSNEAKDILRGQIFQDEPFEFVPYVTPGKELSDKILGSRMIFLENHGLITLSSDKNESESLTEYVDQKCKHWLSKNIETLIDTESPIQEYGPLFPDAGVFPSEMGPLNHHILHLLRTSGLTPKFLSSEEVNKLYNMPEEQYRQSLC